MSVGTLEGYAANLVSRQLNNGDNLDIKVVLPLSTQMNITVYRGEFVAMRQCKNMPNGIYTMHLITKRFLPGMYWIHMQAPGRLNKTQTFELI